MYKPYAIRSLNDIIVDFDIIVDLVDDIIVDDIIVDFGLIMVSD